MNTLKMAGPLLFAILLLTTTPASAQPPPCSSDQVMPTLIADLIKLVDAQSQPGPDALQTAQEVGAALQDLETRCYGGATPTPPTVTPVPPDVTTEPSAVPQSAVVTMKHVAGVFKTASSDTKIGDLFTCDQVSVIDQVGNWVEIDHQIPLVDGDQKATLTGWVFTDLLADQFKGKRLVAVGAVDVFPDPANQSAHFSLSPNQSYNVVDVQTRAGNSTLMQVTTDDGQTGWVEADKISASFKDNTVTSGQVIRVRTDAGTDKTLIGEIAAGSTLRILDINSDPKGTSTGTWLNVERHLEGWVDSDFVFKYFPEGTQVSTTTRTNLRSDGNFGAPSLATIPKNTQVKIEQVSADHDWARVSFQTWDGWVNMCLMSDLVVGE